MRPSQIETKFVTRPSVEQLVADMRRTAELLEQSLQAELERAPTKDPAAFNYPMLARSLGTRLANIRSTIAAIEAARPQARRAA
jgi:hypothetical protein